MLADEYQKEWVKDSGKIHLLDYMSLQVMLSDCFAGGFEFLPFFFCF